MGAGPAAGADGNVDQRINKLERELASLKQDVSGEEGSAEESGDADLPWVSAKDGSFTFTGGMRIQPRYSYNGKLINGHNFQINRLRLKGKGQVTDLAKYYAEFKFTSNSLGNGSFGTFTPPGTPQAENAWIEFNTLPHANLRIGLYDIPFSRNALTSDSKLLFMDRSLIKMLLDDVGFADNTIGALFHEVGMDGRFAYAFGVFDNNKVSGGLPTTAGRFTMHLMDPGKKEGSRGSYGNYRGSYVGEGSRLEIGANVAYTPDADGVPCATPTTGCSGAAAMGMPVDLYAVVGDLFYNSGPWTLQGEYDWYNRGGMNTKGGYVQVGYLLDSLIERVCTASWVPPTELAVRYQDVDTKDVFGTGGSGSGLGRTQAVDVGMNYYIRGHNLKVQTTYTYFDREAGGTSNRYQLQLQLDF